MNSWISKHYTNDANDNVWCKPEFSGIQYNDGDEVETRIASIIEKTDDVSVLSDDLRLQCNDWPSLYHLSPLRSNLLRPFSKEIAGKTILEIGSGCGAITRFLAESGAIVTALEGSKRRAKITRNRVRNFNNVNVICDKFSDFSSPEKFDIITLIGVLEYAAKFTDSPTPTAAMLAEIRKLLKPDGRLIIAIENKLGLKYFAGASEDHVGIPMYGVENLYTEKEVHTFGKSEISTLLDTTGFETQEYYLPFPDYKVPRSILSEKSLSIGMFDASSLAAQGGNKDPQLPAVKCFSPELAWRTCFENHIASEVSNSFLIIASGNGTETIRKDGPGAIAWHYSVERRNSFCKETEFQVCEGATIRVHTRSLASKPSDEEFSWEGLHQKTHSVTNYITGIPLVEEVTKLLARHGWSITSLGLILRPYLKLLIDYYGDIDSNPADPTMLLKGASIDCIPQNIIIDRHGDYKLFDQEWVESDLIELQWVIFRAAISIVGSSSKIARCQNLHIETPIDFVKATFQALEINVRDVSFEDLMLKELEFQWKVTGQRKDSTELMKWLTDAEIVKDGIVHAYAYKARALDEVSLTLGTCSAEKASIVEQLSLVRSDHKNLLEQLENRTNEVERMKTSTSWKLTHPLRLIGRLLKPH